MYKYIKKFLDFIFALLFIVILLIPMIIILPKFLGIDGVWFAQPASDIISAIITSIILYKDIKKYKVNTEKEESEIA